MASPICSQEVDSRTINAHIDAGCSQPQPSSSPFASTSKSVSPVTPAPRKAPKMSSSQQTGTRRTNIAPIFNIKPKGVESLPSSSESTSSVKREANAHRGNSEEGPPRKRCRVNLEEAAPLAERLRPRVLSDFIGHESVVSLIASGNCGSLILWGPSGRVCFISCFLLLTSLVRCGKTTLARLIATQSDAVFKELSATVAGINDVRTIVDAAKSTLSLTGRKTILFMDEIHRFNKGQQDIFLPFLERGYIQLIGATTENPSFKLVGALLSRCRVFSLERLQDADIRNIISKALSRLSSSSDATSTSTDTSFSPGKVEPVSSPEKVEPLLSSVETPSRELTPKIISTIVSMSAGDARIAISLLELAVKAHDLDEAKVLTLLRRSVATSYDTAEDHYNMISALHKSIRGSQPDAALYWLARMLTGGEDPVYICRRMVVCASEDIGLADNHALPLAVATLQACQQVGMPECRINLAHLVSYLSEAPKSTRAYEAYKQAEEAALKDPSLPVPLEMRNAPTALMKEVGYGKSYRYNPEYAHPVHNTYLPLQFQNSEFLKKVGDTSGKMWDEDALVIWENNVNGGEPWKGRAIAADHKG
ncbi:ATPase WRNIP1 C26H5.02c [Mycena venus]|uniref:ATPase WRNIP1 C26H5.02c n=1 Tax=Mycena venus TaxID=2733690 RepID=A0A8H7D7S0_9AGAR|nr:ATPase WRNIP1 C26H5.02c [Mycena venus]